MKKVHIYTDGSSRGNPGPGGYGTILMSGEHKKELSEGFKKTTNNRMELMAVIVGLEKLNAPCEVEVFSDSKYVINAMLKGWIHGWRKKGWVKADKKPLKNTDLWKRLYEAMQAHDVKWNWVKGHAGNKYNERCDYLATFAAKGKNLLEDVGFNTLEDTENLFTEE
jgi:ribonuclease HI